MMNIKRLFSLSVLLLPALLAAQTATTDSTGKAGNAPPPAGKPGSSTPQVQGKGGAVSAGNATGQAAKPAGGSSIQLGQGAQNMFDNGDAAANAPAWQGMKLPSKKIKLDFRNANADMVIAFFSTNSGITIIKDPNLNQPLTVMSAKAVSWNDAFQILEQVLELRGFRLTKVKNMMVIKTLQQRQPQIQLPPGGIQGLLNGPQQGEPIVLKTYPIQYANAAQVARVINEVFGQQQNNNPFGVFFVGGQQQTRPGQPTVHASSDDFSNTVIVNAPQQVQDQIAILLKDIDKPSTDPQHTKIYKLINASAEDLIPTVQNVLTSNAPKGRGGQGTQNVPIEQRFAQAFRAGNAQSAFGTVVADDRTNSLVVTATDDNMKLLDTLIPQLDSEVHVESTTFVVPLDNAKSDDVMNLLQSAFGTRQGVNTNNRNNNGLSNGTRNSQNNNAGNTNNRGGGFNNNGGTRIGPSAMISPDGKDLMLDTNDDGTLKTQIGWSAPQFGQFGGGRQGGGRGLFGGNQQQQSTQTGRGANGQLVNINDLTNQVTVVSDPNTNSLLIVTTPQNAEMIRQIIAQLDRLPEQVVIETKIVEANIDDTNKFGIEWQFTQAKAFGQKGVTGVGGDNFGSQSGLQGTTPGFTYTLGGGNLAAFLQALETNVKFNILQAPRIFTSNNIAATINISQSLPYVTSSVVDAQTGNVTNSYGFEDVGIVLTVTPHITANGYVTMEITQTDNTLAGYAPGSNGTAPIINQRIANTTINVKDGESVLLGGIIQQSVSATTNKVPILGDIPILGNLFKSTTREKQKTELLILLQPNIIRNSDDARKLRQKEEKQLSPQSQDQLKQLDNGGGNVKKDKKNPPKGGW